MDPNLHQKMGVAHMNRVLNYAPFVMEDGKAEVHLTVEDWYVVADTLFKMDTPKEMLPEAVQSFELKNGDKTIELVTEGCVISVEQMP